MKGAYYSPVSWRDIRLCRGGRYCLLCIALSATAIACGPKATPPVDTRSEGGSDDAPRFGTSPALGNPPTIDATAPAADFLIEVSELIQPAWASFLEDCRVRLPLSNPLNDSELMATMLLTIEGSGKVLTVGVLTSSGNTDFDVVASEILNDVVSLPEPPAEWISDDDQVQVVWKFARDIRQAGSAGGSIRRVKLPIAEALSKHLAAGEIAKATQRAIDAGGRSLPSQQIEQIIERALELALSEDDPTIKAQALRVIAVGELSAFKERARAALDSTDSEVALAATEAMGTVGDKTDIARLEALTQGKRIASAATCEAAATSLNTLGRGPQTVATAAQGIGSADAAERLAALAVLAQLESAESVLGLAKILNGSNNKKLRDERMAAARALGKQAPKNASAVRALLAGTAAPDAAVRAGCISALGAAAQAGMRSRVAYWKVLEFVSDKDERVRAAAVRAAAKLDPVRFSKELNRVRAGGSKLVVLSIAEVLGDLPGAIALGRLLDLAAAPHIGMRSAAARGLAKRDNDKAILALQKLLADDAPAVRVMALTGLKGADRLKPFLQDTSPEVRAAALSALTRELGRARTTRLVAAELAASGSERRLQLLWAQAWLGSE